MASAFPTWLRLVWLGLAPLGLSFAARIAWEKTVWTWSKGPQMVGFSLMHIHPLFFIAGIFSCFGLGLWLLPAAIYLIKKRKETSKVDIVMTFLGLFAILALMVPDSFFA